MEKPIITIAGESREMNEEELAQYQKDQAAFEVKLQLMKDEEAKKAALLERLGITEAEAKLLLS
jgi:hypothetical protein